MSITNGYDETSSEGMIKLLKTSFNLMSNSAVGEAIRVIEQSVNNDKEGIKEFCSIKREQKAKNQTVQREKEEKAVSLDDFGEMEY